MKGINPTKALIVLIAVLVSTLVFQSCTKATPLTQEEMNGYWVLKTLNDQDAKSLFSGALPTLQFHFDNNTISGTGGCNRYTGSYTYKEGILSAPNIVSTKMLCVGNNSEEQFFLELSNADNMLSIENGLLTISRDKKIVMQFEKGTEPTADSNQISPESLNGTWILKTIGGTEASSKYTTEPGKIPTISFDFNENRVYGNSGCNNYNSSFSLDKNGQVIISQPMSTMMACPNLEGENQFIQAIIDTSMISLPDSNTLHFKKKDMISLIFEKTTTE